MPKRYDRMLGWVDDELGLAHSRDLDAWVRGDGVIRFKDGRVTTLDSLQGDEQAKAREAQRRAGKLKPTAQAPVAPSASGVLPPTQPTPPPGTVVEPPPWVKQRAVAPTPSSVPAPAQITRAPKQDPLNAFAALLRG